MNPMKCRFPAEGSRWGVGTWRRRGVRASGFEGEVQGELYRLNTPERTLAALDEYEGEEFERVVVKGAWLYQYKGDPPEEARIASGDFRAP